MPPVSSGRVLHVVRYVSPGRGTDPKMACISHQSMEVLGSDSGSLVFFPLSWFILIFFPHQDQLRKVSSPSSPHFPICRKPVGFRLLALRRLRIIKWLCGKRWPRLVPSRGYSATGNPPAPLQLSGGDQKPRPNAQVRMGGGSVNRGTSTMYCMSSQSGDCRAFDCTLL